MTGRCARVVMATRLRVVRARLEDVRRVLRLEEGLLRHRARECWLTMCDGARAPCVVLGLGSKMGELVREDEARARDVALVRRFTGGGTVVCDENTMFVGMTMDSAAMGRLEGGAAAAESTVYPRDVMRATGKVYERVFDKCGTFAVRENDYVFGDLKFGGNAQAITKGRFLHHTSFLYDYDGEFMNALLKHPTRAPEYRNGRDHEAFVTKLAEAGYERAEVFDRIVRAMEELGFDVEEVSLERAERAVKDAVKESGGKRWDSTKTL